MVTTHWTTPVPGLTLPVPPETVAVFKYPLPLDALGGFVKMLERSYGAGLVIRTDAGIDGWMVVARPTNELDTPGDIRET